MMNRAVYVSIRPPAVRTTSHLREAIELTFHSDRQRKALNPPFTTASIREIVSIFYGSGYKVKAAWDDILSKANAGEAIVNIQKW